MSFNDDDDNFDKTPPHRSIPLPGRRVVGQRDDGDDDYDDDVVVVVPVMKTQQQQRQRNWSHRKWHDMPYAALQLIALYGCHEVYDALILGQLFKRMRDVITNYLPADVWRDFYQQLLTYYRFPPKKIRSANIPCPDTFDAFSAAARYWHTCTSDARALRAAFCYVQRHELHDKTKWNLKKLGTVREWSGVAFEDDDDDVISTIDLSCAKELQLGGPVHLSLLPNLTKLDMRKCGISGRCDLTRLPSNLKVLQLGWNQLSGDINLTALPSSLQQLCLDNNHLTGNLNLGALPKKLAVLGLAYNQFEGNGFASALSEGLLPNSLQQILLCHNMLSGSLDLSRLPTALSKLNVRGNRLSGPLALSKMPEGVQSFVASDNSFSGDLDVTSASQLPWALEELVLSNNSFSGGVDFSVLPDDLRFLLLAHNNLSGPLNFSDCVLPSKLEDLALNGNQFDGFVDLTELPDKLEMLNLSKNRLSGAPVLSMVPKSLRLLHLGENNFSSGSSEVLCSNTLCKVTADRSLVIRKESIINTKSREIYVRYVRRNKTNEEVYTFV